LIILLVRIYEMGQKSGKVKFESNEASSPAIIVEDYDHQVWKATLKLVRNLCKIMRTSLQDFWKLCRIYAEDRIQKSKQATFPMSGPNGVNTGTPTASNPNLASSNPNLAQGDGESKDAPKVKRRADVRKLLQCQSMIKNIVELYSTILSHAFFLETSLVTIRNAARNPTSYEHDYGMSTDPTSKTGATAATSSGAGNRLSVNVTGTNIIKSPSIVSAMAASSSSSSQPSAFSGRPQSVLGGVPISIITSATPQSSNAALQPPSSPTRPMSIVAGVSPASSMAAPAGSAVSAAPSNYVPTASILSSSSSSTIQSPQSQQIFVQAASSASPSIRSSVIFEGSSSSPFGAIRRNGTDVQVTAPPPTPPAPPLDHGSSFLAAHPLTCVHWVSKVIGELVRCFEEVRAMRVGGGTAVEERVLRSVGGCADFVRRRCVESACEGLLLGM
jgi:hypothetical protein